MFKFTKTPILAIAICALSAGVALADIGQIKTLKGDVRISRGGADLVAKAGDALEQFDTLSTGPNGSVGMTFIDGARFSAGPNSVIELSRFKFNPTTHDGEFQTRVKRGTLAVISGQIAKRSPTAMTVRTPASILGVRGTRFLVKVGEGN
ncbi:MAG: FecR domain-containing protein [Alphaproteobacteria bacterium]|nr:FecR domain-containing protein [Alphaproteobacteria bacterium]